MGALNIGGEGGGCAGLQPRAVGDRLAWFRRMASPALFVLALTAPGFAWALDGSQTSPPMEKIPLKLFKSAQQALRTGIEELRAGDSKSSVEALKYAAEGGQSLAQWKLGRMYADGDGVPHDDLKAYQYFDQIVRNYNEDESDRRDIGAVSNAVVAIGIYSLNGIANSPIQPDPDRAFEMFQYAATNFGDPDAQYNLARMYLDGVGGIPKNNMRAARWLSLAAEKRHHPAQAVLGHLLFVGDGVPRQRARGLMWLTIAKDAARGPKDQWMNDLYAKDFAAAADEDKQVAAVYLSEYAKTPEATAPVAPPAAATTRAPAPLADAPPVADARTGASEPPRE
jgi:exopolysaccharide production negative regulator